MKKVLLLLSFLVAFFVSNAQYPVIQWIGRDSALVDSRGGFKARLINYPFTDTTQANTQRISQYAGALIYTTSGGDKLWLRNSTATAWDRIGTSSGGGGGIVSLGASAYGLIIQNDSTYKADTIQLSTRLWRQKGIDSVQGNVTSGLALKLNLSDTASMLTNYVRRQELKDTAAAIRSAIGGGGTGDTIVYSHNPSTWLVSQPAKRQPYFYTSGVAGDPTGSYYETSQYTPTPIYITSGANKGKYFVVVKGDFQRSLFGWISSDKCVTWDTTGVVLSKSATGWDKSGVSMAHMIYDSATNVIHMWYMGYSDSTYPSVFGVGYATSSGDSPSTFTKQGEVLSGANFATQIGMPHTPGYLKVSSVVKGRETGKYYFHGSYWIGNAATWSDSTIRLWQGTSATISGLIDSCQQILAPTGTNTLLENPTVYYGDDSLYWMIFTNGYMDGTPTNGIDSVQYLMSAKTTSLKNPSWSVQPGILFYPMRDSSWQGKRVYNAQLLKNGYDYYDRPISIRHDSTGRGVVNYSESEWLLFYSASYPNSYHDQASILRILPQRSSQNTYAIGFNGNFPNIIQSNGTAFVNIPWADTISKSGYLFWQDYRNLNRMVKSGTAGRLAFYDSSLQRVRDLPTMSVTTGNYPTFTLGASGYNAASLLFRNAVGTTGMISEDAGMSYYASSTYMSHIWRDKVSGGIVLGRMWSSSGSPYAYFPGKTTFGSNAQATSHLQTDKTFAAVLVNTPKTSTYTLADSFHITADATAGAFTIYPPQPNICPGRIYWVTKTDASANAVTIDATTYGKIGIGGSSTYALSSQGSYVAIQSSGSNTTGWYILSSTSSAGSSLTVDSLTYNNSTSAITLNLTGQSDVSVTLPGSYVVNAIHPDSTSKQVNDSTLKLKAVTVSTNDPELSVNTVRTDSTINHQVARNYVSEPLFSMNAGAGFAVDTTIFTDSTLYGSFFTGQDSIYITQMYAVLKGAVGDTLGIQLIYNDSINVTGTIVGGGTYAVNSRTTGNDLTVSTNRGIPPNSWVWLKSPTVIAGKKPEYLSITLIGYRKYQIP